MAKPFLRDISEAQEFQAGRNRKKFPSEHSTTAFAVALSLGSFYPEARPLLLILAANVAVSRVVVGMHFLSGARHMSCAVQVRSVQGGGFHSVKTESPVPARFQAL